MTLRTFTKRLLTFTPYRLSRTASNRFDGIEECLRQLARGGYRPRCIIDGGAHLGWFARCARAVFPGAEIHLVDPQPACAPTLQRLAETPGFHFHPVALTSERKIARMVCDSGPDTGAHVAWDGNLHRANTDVQGETLDSLFASHVDADSRALLKLDLQGHELLALAGGRQILKHVEVVLAEFSFFGQLGEAPVSDLVRFMDEAGFDLFDIASVAGRRRDGRARHGDFVFARRNTPLWTDRGWE
ncbi:MAG: FkbM family methyltransferase [Reyranella sp.]|uniref:FkbM family methyltransferase n=1 Tax=Reyranella sp. TaxID=1929291 RepID=UPI001AD43EFC|nr:FkbM family methyltransferase [Reyranella sp.]MBN9089500.1 FkbM family methyltransferase [Reyranella sp.]